MAPGAGTLFAALILLFNIPLTATSPPARDLDRGYESLWGEMYISGGWTTLHISPDFTFTYYRVDGGVIWYVPGAPPIPALVIPLELEGDIVDVEVRYSGETSSTLPDGAIRPLPEPTSHFLRPRAASLEVGGRYPKEDYILASLGYSHRGENRYHAYALVLFPVRYDLQKGTLKTHVKVSYRITFNKGLSPLLPAPTAHPPEDVLHTVVPPQEAPPVYIIVTPSYLLDEMMELARYRTTLGYPSAVVTVEDVKSLYPSQSPPLALKSFLIWARGEYPGFRYVLLAGDWDKVPVMRVIDSNPYPGYDDGYIPSDTFYACLDSDWDEDNDGIYGEMGDLGDIIPDLVVTRLAINDESRWRAKIEQIKGYETTPSVGSWPAKALLIGANTHNAGDGEAQSEYLWDKYLSDVYGTKVPLYEGKGLSRSAISSNIEQGVGMINFVDHGGPTVWCDNYGMGVVYSNSDASARRNLHMEPVVSTLACLTTWFDDPSGCSAQNFDDCIGEAFTENVNGGSTGYVGSSRTSVGVLGTNSYLPYDNGLQEDFARALTLEDLQGEVFTEAKRHYAASWGGLFNSPNNVEVTDTWLEYNFLGEPLIPLWKSEPRGLSVNINHTDSLTPTVRVSVTDSETSAALPGATVTLEWAAEGIWEQAVTDGSGEAILTFSIPRFGDINISVRKAGYLPFMDYVTIRDTLPPVTSIRILNGTEGENGWYLSQPLINLSTDEPARTFYRWDSGEDVEYTGEFEVPEGVHSLYYYSIDLYGNVERERQSIFKVDLHDPVVEIRVEPSEPDGEESWYRTAPLVTLLLNSSVPSASEETIFYRLDSGGVTRYTAPFAIEDGEHTISFWAEEESGRVSGRMLFEIKVDTVPPKTTIRLDPSEPDGKNGYYVTPPTVTLSSPEGESIYYRLSLDEDFKLYRGPFAPEEGHHILQYYSVDEAGNAESIREKEIWVDSRPPQVKVEIDPERPDGKNGYYTERPTLRFYCNDTSPTTIFYRVDEGPVKTVKGPLTLDDGNHVLMIYAEDEAGNRYTLPSIRIRVDTTPPEVHCIVSGDAEGGIYRRIFSIDLFTEEMGDTIYYRWDGEPAREYTGALRPPGDEGTYTLYYWGEDEAGNRCPEDVMIIRYDSEAPRGSVDYTEERGGKVTLLLDGITDGMGVEKYVIDYGDGTVRTVPASEKTPTHTYRRTGSYTITVKAYDSAGNEATFTVGIVVGVMDLYLPHVIGLILIIIAVLAATLVIYLRRQREILLMEIPEAIPLERGLKD